MDRRGFLRRTSLVGLAAGLGVPACRSKAPPNLLLIVIDTLRADRLGCHGANVSTPTIDGLAAGGVRFDRAYCHIPVTLPSHVSMFTSTYPHEGGPLNNGQPVSAEKTLLAEMLAQRGYRTLGIPSLGTLAMGIDQGMETFLDPQFPFLYEVAETTNDRLFSVGGLSSLGSPFFLFLHYADPHAPYHAHGAWTHPVEIRLDGELLATPNVADETRIRLRAPLPAGRHVLSFAGQRGFQIVKLFFSPEECDVQPLSGVEPRGEGWIGWVEGTGELAIDSRVTSGRPVRFTVFVEDGQDRDQLRAAYDAEVAHVDAQLGQALARLEELGLLDNTAVVLTSDHGESLGEHGHVGHIHQLYEPLLRVPLILRYPGQLPRGAVLDSTVRHIDLLPTIAELLQLDSVPGQRGTSLLPMVRGEEAGDRPLLAMTFRDEARSDKAALLEGRVKLIADLDTGQQELYDLTVDPQELHDLSGERPELLDQMAGRLASEQTAVGFPGDLRDLREGAPPLEERTREMLRALGYAN